MAAIDYPGTPELSSEPKHSSGLPEFAWNRKELLERLEGDTGLLRELLSLFRNDVQSNLARCKTALSHSDFEELSSVAHTLKGMLKNLSMTGVADIAAALEKEAHKKLAGESGELLTRLESALAGILAEVDAQLREAQT